MSPLVPAEGSAGFLCGSLKVRPSHRSETFGFVVPGQDYYELVCACCVISRVNTNELFILENDDALFSYKGYMLERRNLCLKIEVR